MFQLNTAGNRILRKGSAGSRIMRFQPLGPAAAQSGPKFLFGDGTYSQNIFLPQTQIDRTLGTSFGDLNGYGGYAAAFDGNTSQGIATGAAIGSAGARYIGKDYGLGNEKCITGFRVYGSTDQGFCDSGAGTVTHTLYGSNTSPANGTDGVILGTVTAANATGTPVVSKFDIVNKTFFRYVWMRQSGAQITNCGYVEVQFFENGTTGAAIQPQASYSFYGPDIAPNAAITINGTVNNGYVTSNLVDGNNSTGASLSGGNPTDRYIFDYTTPKKIRRVVTSCNFGSFTIQARLQYSDDGAAWTTVQDITTPLAASYTTTDIADVGSHRYWSLLNIGSSLQFTTVQMMEYLILENVVRVTSAATITPDANNMAYIQGTNLVMDGATASITPTTSCKALFSIFSQNVIAINGAGSSMTAKGFGGQVLEDPTLYSLIPSAYRTKFTPAAWSALSIKKDGAEGGPAKSGGGAGIAGSAGVGWQTGGGGSGGVTNSGVSGKGGKGSAFSGGSGGGGITNTGTLTAGTQKDASDYGLKAGDGYSDAGDYGSGGAGNPGGFGCGPAPTRNTNYDGGTGTGGVLIFAAPNIKVYASSVFQADGVVGGSSPHNCGGSSGGGIAAFVYSNEFHCYGTQRANGGPIANGSGGTASGAGGNGTTPVVKIS